MIEPATVTAETITPVSMPTPTAPPTSAEKSAGGSPPPAAAPSPALDPAKVDRGGIVFDPARHIDRQNRHTGRWMPRGGRKPGSKAAPPSTDNKPPAPSFIPKAPPPAPLEEINAAPTPPAAAPAADHSEDAAECAARALQFSAGTVFDAHKDCTPPPDEHRSMVRAFAGYIRSKGWQATAGVAAGIVVAAWLLRVLQKDAPAAKVRSWLGADKSAAAIDVTGTAAKPVTVAPAAPAQVRSVFDLIPPEEPNS